jgi:alkaline phosphatase
MISSRSIIGWTTSGHVGDDLFLYVFGLGKPMGMIENTEIARISACALGFDLDLMGRRLFVDAEKAFGALGADTRIDATDSTNRVLVVEKGAARAVLPFSKDLVRLEGSHGRAEYELEGLTVFAPGTGRVYVPEEAVRLFNRHSGN